jgi:hypothetical protein
MGPFSSAAMDIDGKDDVEATTTPDPTADRKLRLFIA